MLNYTYQDLYYLNERKMYLIHQLHQKENEYQCADKNKFITIEGVPYNYVEYLEQEIFGLNSYLGSIYNQIDEAEKELGLHQWYTTD